MKKVTLEMIALEANTTKNTVSRALRGKTGVSDELRKHINQIADNLGYMRKPEQEDILEPTKVTMVYNSSLHKDIYFWPTVMGGIFEHSAKHHISMHSVIVDMIQDDIKYLLPLQEKHCDGILILGTLPEAQFARIEKLGIPMIAIDHFSNHISCDYVNVANANGMIKAVDFLAANGHRKIGFVNNDTAPHIYSLTRRFRGYEKRMEQLGLTIDPRFIWNEASYNDNNYLRKQFEKYGKLLEAPTAWVCSNDVMAYNFCNVLKEYGLRVPEDVSVIGFDNIPGMNGLPLTTLSIPQADMGRRALRRLMRRMRFPNEPFENIEIFTSLVDKGSVKKI